MPLLIAPNGKTFDTRWIKGGYEPFFCHLCGERIGWTNDDNQGLGMGSCVCEDCIADMQED